MRGTGILFNARTLTAGTIVGTLSLLGVVAASPAAAAIQLHGVDHR